MTCCTDRAKWTGVTPGVLALVLGSRAGIDAVASGHCVMRSLAASDFLR